MENESGISEPILLAVTRFLQKEVRFGLFAHHGQGGQDIGTNANNNHLDATECLRKTCPTVS